MFRRIDRLVIDSRPLISRCYLRELYDSCWLRGWRVGFYLWRCSRLGDNVMLKIIAAGKL